jgi:hypothetical protein
MSGSGYTIRKALLLNMVSKDLGLQPIKATGGWPRAFSLHRHWDCINSLPGRAFVFLLPFRMRVS